LSIDNLFVCCVYFLLFAVDGFWEFFSPRPTFRTTVLPPLHWQGRQHVCVVGAAGTVVILAQTMKKMKTKKTEHV
jgi:hypothetical protein